MATETPTASPTARTLSAAFADDRRREARRRAVPAGLVKFMLHRWGAACLPKSRAALSGAATPPPPPQTQTQPSSASAQASARQRHADAANVAARRPLREKGEAAAAFAVARAPTPTGSQDKPVTPTGDGSGWSGDTATTVGRGANIWVRVPRKRTSSPQVDSPQQLSVESTASAAEDEYAWADRYRPNVLAEFICNKAVADELHRLVTEQECNHFIFEGGQAVGKRSMVLALLRDAFGPDNLQVQEHSKRIELKGEIARHVDVKVKISGHHVEVNLADLHGYENHVITTLLNESILPPDSICDHTNCKVIVVHDADRLSSDFQHYIGWFLGRYAGCNKIIFCCSDSSNLEAVKHLCKVVTLQPPSFEEMIKVLEFIAMKEGIDLPRGIASRITVSASNNLRQAIRSFEATWKANYPFVEDQPILTGWEEEIYNVAKKIMEEPSPKQLYLIRGKFQKEQVKEYRSRDTTLDISIEHFAVEGRDQGEAIQYFIKIEEFTVRFMSFYRSWQNSPQGS
ncbi:replication factor C subunit 3-like isoform X1 [Triticum dicoccoides]|uniref:replication factor C subunit 3-like isoform X1 n=1 Tax=Triticum dicoccoides TaxID=85692 RepID=UPI00188F8D85|nr:replication factor C subunit 3-like isoform X1 [Triticum dicoccoides]